jgi:Tetratricopeptide repeat
MLASSQIALAQVAGQTVVAAAVTDTWEAAETGFARLLGRGDPDRTRQAAQRLSQTREQLIAAAGADLESARSALEAQWVTRLGDLLEEDPGAEADLRALVEEIRAMLPAAVAAGDDSIAAGRDMNITAAGGGVAAGVIHGSVMPPDPYQAGPGVQLAGSGSLWNLGPGSVVADRGSVAVGHVQYPNPQPTVESQLVRLPPRPAFLAGREELFAELDVRLSGDDGPGPQTVVLCGLGGVGKTSVAVEYAHRRLTEVGVAWQFPADDATVLQAGFAELAAQLGVRDVVDTRDPVASVHGVLAAYPRGWLLILDNAPDRASVEAFLPPAGHGQVLITSQNQNWPPSLVMEVPVLASDIAADFLVNRTADPDRQAAQELADELGWLPLALEQAAAYIDATGTSLAAYLTLFRRRRPDMLARGEPTGYVRTVATSWALAFAQLEESAPRAAGLLRLLAFYAPEAIPLRLLLQHRRGLDQQLSPEIAPVLMPLLDDPLEVAEAIAALGRYSLITTDADGAVSVQRLVQAVTADQMPGELARAWQRAAAAVIEAAIPDDPKQPDTWPDFAKLLPHVQAALTADSDSMRRVAAYLGDSGSYRAACELYQRVVEAQVQALGPEHPDTLAARGNLAYWTGQAGDAIGARNQYAALVPLIEQVRGPDHPDALNTRANLAYWTGAAGDVTGARDQLTALEPVFLRHLGPEHPDTLAARAHLAYWTGMAGEAAGARDQYAVLVPAYERVLGSEHPDSMTGRASLAYWTGAAGDAAGARDLFASLLPEFERILGPEHPGTLTARASLARWTGAAGDAANARDQFAGLLPQFDRILGSEHPGTLDARASLARWTGAVGEAANARDQYAALLPLRELALGPEHPDTLAARRSLAYWTGAAGDVKGARDQCTALLPVIERVLGPGHPDALGARRSVAYWTGVADGSLATA